MVEHSAISKNKKRSKSWVGKIHINRFYALFIWHYKMQTFLEGTAYSNSQVPVVLHFSYECIAEKLGKKELSLPYANEV